MANQYVEGARDRSDMLGLRTPTNMPLESSTDDVDPEIDGEEGGTRLPPFSRKVSTCCPLISGGHDQNLTRI